MRHIETRTLPRVTPKSSKQAFANFVGPAAGHSFRVLGLQFCATLRCSAPSRFTVPRSMLPGCRHWSTIQVPNLVGRLAAAKANHSSHAGESVSIYNTTGNSFNDIMIKLELGESRFPFLCLCCNRLCRNKPLMGPHCYSLAPWKPLNAPGASGDLLPNFVSGILGGLGIV